MPVYKYKGRHITGKKVKGYYEAPSVSDLVSYLETVEVYPFEFSYVLRDTREKFSAKRFFLRKTPSREKLVNALRVILTLYKSGINFSQALREAALASGDSVLSTVFLSVNERMAQGMTFSEACAEYPHVFDPIMVESLRIGEVTGTIEKALESQIERLVEENAIRKTVKTQSLYPTVLISIVVLVFFLLTGVFIPKLIGTYKEMLGNFKLPPKAQFFIETNMLISKYSFLAPLVPLFAVSLFILPRVSKSVRKIRDKIFLKIPIVKELVSAVELARIAGGFHTCSVSGLSIRETLSLVEQSVSNSEFKRVLGNGRLLVESGSLLSQAIQSSLFPDLFISLVKAGEATGRLPETMLQAQRFYLDLVKGRLQILLSCASYVVLFFLGLIVAYVILSVVIPMFEMPSVISGGLR